MKRLRILTCCSVILAGAIFLFKKTPPTTIPAGKGLVIDKTWLTVNQSAVTPQKDIRPADQTFLTFPEWYLVFSPEEQADYFKTYTATSFPFMSHVAQIWQSYGIVNNQIRDNFPVNKGYHFMIWVIGSSASAEYAIKALYETVVGRLTDTHFSVTEEDAFNAKFTADYVRFIKERPWYEFDFKKYLESLWASTPVFGGHLIRKIERKYILTSELIVKIVYGKLIGLGTKTVYEEALPETVVLITPLPSKEDSMRVIRQMPDNTALVALPRYDRFNAAVNGLAKKGYSFKEIAGNNSAILLTLLVPSTMNKQYDHAQVIFTQPISSDRKTKRIALAVKVDRLNDLVRQLAKDNITIEHIFDY